MLRQDSRTPTELLEQFEECWDELGEDREDRKVLDFTQALSAPLRQRLSLNPAPTVTLREAEDRANAQFRLLEDERAAPAIGGGRKRHQSALSQSAGRPETKRANSAQPGPEHAREGYRFPRGQVTCCSCRQVGHTRDICTNKHVWNREKSSRRNRRCPVSRPRVLQRGRTTTGRARGAQKSA